MIKNLLLTTDFSDLARTAYHAAVDIARQYGATLYLAHVTGPEGRGRALAGGLGSGGRSAQHELEEEVRRPPLSSARLRVELLRSDPSGDVLLDLVRARDIDLIVVATHGRSGLRHAVLGSFAEKLVRRAPVPVLAYREKPGIRHPAGPRTVLVPYDFSENATAVFPLVRCLSERYGCRFIFLNVLELDYGLLDRYPGDTYREALRIALGKEAAATRSTFEEIRERELAGVDLVFETAEGAPYLEIVERAREVDADLVVLSTHGRTGLQHVLLGSVAELVVRKASCAVLTVRQPGIPARNHNSVKDAPVVK